MTDEEFIAEIERRLAVFTNEYRITGLGQKMVRS